MSIVPWKLVIPLFCLVACGEKTEDTSFPDVDGDGWTLRSGDCDDENPDIHPGADEVCDDEDVDENCNELADDEDPEVLPSSQTVWFQDGDGDGYAADDAESRSLCEPTGTWEVTVQGDCDDDDDAINPDATEVCDDLDIDEDCSGAADDDDPGVDPATTSTYYPDEDGDGYGDDDGALELCDASSKVIEQAGDCDDGDASINPDAMERCDDDNVDEDCNGWADDIDFDIDPATLSVWYVDADGDGYGDAESSTEACDQPSGYVGDISEPDCDDDDGEVNPGATEVCDEDDTDEDCNGLADDQDPDVDSASLGSWYQDADGDGYGDPTTLSASCDGASGLVTDGTDCDDGDLAINPDATEICDEEDTDEDCSGAADDDDPGVDSTTLTAWFADADGDGYGDPSSGTEACEQPKGHVIDDSDCDDENDAVNPGTPEVCDEDDTDEDCSGLADDDDPGVSPDSLGDWYADADADGYGDPAGHTESCEQPSGTVTDGTDCDDARDDVNPGETEVCDADDTDEDCSGTADDADPGVDATTLSTWYADADADGYGEAGSSSFACDQPAAHTADDSDCDDTRADVNPGETEVCDGGNTDEDCSGAADDADLGVDTATFSTWYADSDGDGYGDTAQVDLACDVPSGHVADDSDCDDTRSDVNPGETEICDATDTDEDCSGDADDHDAGVDASTLSAWYADSDSDGYGDPESSSLACDVPSGHVSDDTDCDDTRADVNPGETEICDATDTDEDCSGEAEDSDPGVDASTFSTWYADGDGDGYGDAASPDLACDVPAGHVADNTDCDDTRGDVNPGETEICDATNTDEDCSGAADDADAGVDASTRQDWYLDTDGDGVGNSADGTLGPLCDQPSGYAATDGDCDETRTDVHALHDEICDGIDNDCDGGTSEDGVVSLGSTAYASLASAVGAASSGETVMLCDGSHSANVTTGVALTLRSLNGASVTELSGGGTGPIVTMGDDLAVEGLTFTAGSGGYGGAIDGESVPGALLTVTDCVLEGNEATYGGAIYAGGLLLEVSGSELSDNQADFGGAIWASDAELSDTTLHDNVANDSGGALYLDAGSSTVLDAVQVYYNEASSGGGVWIGSVELEGGSFYSNTATSGGGAYVDGGTLLDAELRANTASSHGGGVSLDDDASLLGCSVSDNYAPQGGGVSIRGDGVTVGAHSTTAAATTIATNEAGNSGGGIAGLSVNSVSISDTQVTDNTAYSGGGLYLFGSDLLYADALTISGNAANREGGGLYLDEVAEILISDLTVSDNQSGSNGGGGYIVDCSVDMTVDTLTLTGNDAGANGGGFYLSQVSQADLTDMVLETNSGAGRNGGGFYLDSGVYLRASGSSWGTGSTDNTPDDIGLAGTSYWFTASADCDSDLRRCTGT